MESMDGMLYGLETMNPRILAKKRRNMRRAKLAKQRAQLARRRRAAPGSSWNMNGMGATVPDNFVGPPRPGDVRASDSGDVSTKIKNVADALLSPVVTAYTAVQARKDDKALRPPKKLPPGTTETDYKTPLAIGAGVLVLGVGAYMLLKPKGQTRGTVAAFA
jgi:hypothetical protein